MMRRQSAPMYDLFKLIVALILLALLIWIMVRPPSGSFPGALLPGAASNGETSATEPAVAAPSATASSEAAPSAAVSQETEPAVEVPSAAEATEITVDATTAASSAAAAITPTTEPTVESTAELLTVPTSIATLEPTAELQVTPTLEPTIAAPPDEAAPTPTATSGQQADLAACAALTSRLAVGDSARVMTNLIFRSSPGIENNRIRTHPPGTLMEVTGGPQCIPYQGGAYLWWELRHSDGSTGWSAEGSISTNAYFLQPVE